MLRLLVLGSLLIALNAHAQAPAWKPTRPIEIVNPASPGGSVDLMCRSLKKFMEDNKLTDQPINVLYKTGANGAIALDHVNQQQAGETLLAAAIPLKAAGVDIKQMTNVPYRSGPEAIAAVLGGHLDVALVSAVNPAGNVQSGKMRVLTQTGPVRGSGYLKDVPTWKELGVNVDYATAQGFMGPKTMPPQAVPYWEGVLARFAKDPEWQKLLERSLWENAYMTAPDMRKYYEAEFASVKSVLGELGLTKQ
jgi:tripartite-type tricarboxylate transporter receptor subunit TctC